MDVEEFTGQEPVVDRLKRLKKSCAGKIFSDLLDDEGNQYVDLVMEGGGVLGVALVGYTYVLEEMGLRFRGAGGTSAGSINALLVAALGPPQARKSEQIVKLLADLRMFEFVDGDADVKDFVEKVAEGAGKFTLAWKGVQVLDTLDENLGLNPGGAFFAWVSRALIAAGAHTASALAERIATVPPGFRHRLGRPLPYEGTGGRLALVAADVSTETKVELPKMAPMYWKRPDKVDPALFARASMSIPFFFYPLVLGDLPKGPKAREAWRTLAGYDQPIPDAVKLVDGGIMSNFPIDLFHVPGRVPNAPTFGAKLGRDSRLKHDIRTPFQLAGAVFDSASHCLDYDFIVRHPDYRNLVTWIDTGEHHWLDFFMTDEDKADLFTRGALAAADFLDSFDWGAYKKVRAKLAKAYG